MTENIHRSGFRGFTSLRNLGYGITWVVSGIEQKQALQMQFVRNNLTL